MIKKILLIIFFIPIISHSQYSKILPSPTPLDQGETNMCVSYSLSTIYTILYNRDHSNFYEEKQINEIRMSPTFLYYLFKDEIDFCGTKPKNKKNEGLIGHSNLMWDFLREYGAPFASDVEENFFFPFGESLICSYYPYSKNDLINDIHKGTEYRIFKKEKCGKYENSRQMGDFFVDIEKIKDEINNGRPCIIHGFIAPGLTKFKYSKLDENKTIHWMTIIGYDDTKFNGSFLIQDSYLKRSSSNLPNGRHWIRYEDIDTLQDILKDEKKYSKNCGIFSVEGKIEDKILNKDDINNFIREFSWPSGDARIFMYKDKKTKEPLELTDKGKSIKNWKEKCEAKYYSYELCKCIMDNLKLKDSKKFDIITSNPYDSDNNFQYLLDKIYKDNNEIYSMIELCKEDTIIRGCVFGDCKNGPGKKVYKAGHKKKSYTGEWKDGKYHTNKEHATLIYNNGKKHIGYFKKGLEHGDGILTEKNGTIWEGKWKNGNKHGKFKRTKNGISTEITFKNGIRK